VLALELERSLGDFGCDFGSVLVDVDFGDNGSAGLGGSYSARPRARDGVGEGVNRSVALVVVVEGSVRVFDWELEPDVETELNEEVDVDNDRGWGMGVTGAVFGGGVGPDRSCD